MRGYRTVRRAYQLIVSESLRDQLYRWSPGPLRRLKRQIVAAFERDAAHNEIYNLAYYRKFVEPTMRISAEPMARSILRDLAPRRVLDVGCGTGVLLDELRRRSKNVEVSGLELADAAIAMCVQRDLAVQKFDIERDSPPESRADVVISTEVAEHLPLSCADRFVDLLAGIADTVVLTAATPSQGGTDHVNEQPNEYWIEKMIARGRHFDEPLSMQWRIEWKNAVQLPVSGAPLWYSA